MMAGATGEAATDLRERVAALYAELDALDLHDEADDALDRLEFVRMAICEGPTLINEAADSGLVRVMDDAMEVLRCVVARL